MFKFIKRSIFLLFISLLLVQCDESFLEEIPKDFLSADNAYTDIQGFENGIAGVLNINREFWNGNWEEYMLFGNHTDFAHTYGYLDYSTQSSTTSKGQFWLLWERAYKVINAAQVLITRAESENAEWVNEIQKKEIIAEAKFLRAWGHRMLAHMFGGVPIIREEVASAKLDFVRSTREEVYQFCKEDLEYAAENLPYEEKAPGRVSKAAAYHLLAEIYICLNDWDGAIAAASAVIDDPNYELMTERFGRRADVDGGDVFWDLHQKGNTDRYIGNTEAIWTIQFEYGVEGGGRGSNWEYMWGPRLEKIKDPDGKSGFIKGTPQYGRPIAHITPTNWMQQTVWEDDWDDMRNSYANVRREFYYDNPSSNYYGQKMVYEPFIDDSQSYRYCQCFFMKATCEWDHSLESKWDGRIYKDVYAIRLAETYLLRAEAYLGKGDQDKAAADINVVRTRANATPVDPGDVDIDYILDERARELVVEEMRVLTLTRLGLLYDRVKKCSYKRWADGSVTPTTENETIQPFNNLFPIPQTALDLNSEVVIEQNPGY